MNTNPISTMINPHVRHVLLATDLGASSARAVDEAIHLAAEKAAVLQVLSVVPPAGLRRLGRDRGPDAEYARRGQAAREIVARAGARGVRATSVVWYGDPAESILAAASRERVDVLFLGSRKRTALGRLLLGSVSGRVVRRAACPVVVVPA